MSRLRAHFRRVRPCRNARALDGDQHKFNGDPGDISLNGDKLTFGNGVELPLLKVSESNGRWAPVGGNLPGTIYKLSPPSDPALLNGNTLCGMKKPVTFIVLSEPYKGGLALSVFTGDEPPQGFGVNSCAAYFYER